MTETPTCTYTALATACRQFMPKGLALDNANVADDLTIPLDATMGELRRLQAAIDAADQAADREVSGVALLKLVQDAEDLSTASALVQAALDFLTNDEAALAEGRRWAPDEGGGSNLQKMQVIMPVEVVQDLVTAAVELDRLSLVIDSAVRHSEGANHQNTREVKAALKSLRVALAAEGASSR
ncbi:hypothetical protein V7S57_02195 [Caulobacter sp. CCNWLY153]|uniref:hypothetical protein n=1 Tax=unclassified Caulobacter TaxID=2648921 RepID=UPI002FEEE998